VVVAVDQRVATGARLRRLLEQRGKVRMGGVERGHHSAAGATSAASPQNTGAAVAYPAVQCLIVRTEERDV